MFIVVIVKLQEQFDVGFEICVDFIIDQLLYCYGQVDYVVWKQFYVCQLVLLCGCVCDVFVVGFGKIELLVDCVLLFVDVNCQLKFVIGWEIVVVLGFVFDCVFFEYFVNWCFFVIWWMCCFDQFDYLQEFDCFYDLFGYVLLLIDLVFVDYMQVYGCIVFVVVDDEVVLVWFVCFYWYMVEFGLICDLCGINGLLIYGVGIVLSKGESLYSLESVVLNCFGFDFECVMCMKYWIDMFQKIYFVIDDFV